MSLLYLLISLCFSLTLTSSISYKILTLILHLKLQISLLNASFTAPYSLHCVLSIQRRHSWKTLWRQMNNSLSLLFGTKTVVEANNSMHEEKLGRQLLLGSRAWKSTCVYKEFRGPHTAQGKMHSQKNPKRPCFLPLAVLYTQRKLRTKASA